MSNILPLKNRENRSVTRAIKNAYDSQGMGSCPKTLTLKSYGNRTLFI